MLNSKSVGANFGQNGHESVVSSIQSAICLQMRGNCSTNQRLGNARKPAEHDQKLITPEVCLPTYFSSIRPAVCLQMRGKCSTNSRPGNSGIQRGVAQKLIIFVTNVNSMTLFNLFGETTLFRIFGNSTLLKSRRLILFWKMLLVKKKWHKIKEWIKMVKLAKVMFFIITDI